MNIKHLGKILIISVMLLILQYLILENQSNAAIEIKAETTPHTGININNSFQYCYDMRNQTSSLGNNQLDPHMAKATDWGITAYLGLSAYGAVDSSTGPSITISDVSYTTTTGNKTGVMDFGKNNTHVANYEQGIGSNGNRSKLFEESNSRYVDVIPSTATVENSRGMAYAETSGWKGSTYWVNSNFPIWIRTGIVGRAVGGDPSGKHYHDWGGTGAGSNDSGYQVTYRPVIWN